MKVRLAPSVLAADFSRLGDEVRRVEAAGADFIHIDVMDGRFVPVITFGAIVVDAIKRCTSVPLDVHLMIVEPDRHLDAIADAGASRITVHVEAAVHLHRTVSAIKARGVKAGVALNPATPVAALSNIVNDIDHVLVMNVNPGFTGQKFIPSSLAKIAEMRALLVERGSEADIEVDGGVDVGNARALVEAGATILVAGAAVFHTPDAPQAVQALRLAATR